MSQWDDYKEKKEAQRFFRANNDMFLSKEQWVKTVIAGLAGATLIGIAYAAISMKLSFTMSLFYIVIGYAIANIVTSVSGVSSKQMGILSAVLTFICFYISELAVLLISYSYIGNMGIPLSFVSMIIYPFMSLFHSGILQIIFVIIGIFVAYQQAE